MGIANQHQRLKRLEGAVQQRHDIVVTITEGVDDPNEVIKRMIATGGITEEQRAAVRFIMRRIIEPIWDIKLDGSAKIIGRRNVYTGEIENLGVLTDQELKAFVAQNLTRAIGHTQRQRSANLNECPASCSKRTPA
jgi:hypothetical protein